LTMLSTQMIREREGPIKKMVKSILTVTIE
jgi:hypothetical protein